MKNLILLVTIAVACMLSGCARTEGVVRVNMDADGRAVRGYDVVSFFAENAAIQGKPQIEYVWNGAKWLFSTEENLEKFRAEPERYAPQFGGYCSYAVSHGYTADGDPATWKVVDGKLYLNYNQKAKEAWEKEQEKFIKDGEHNWQEFQSKRPEHKG